MGEREHNLHVRVTEDEMEMLRGLAEADGVNTSDVVRRLVVEEHGRRSTRRRVREIREAWRAVHDGHGALVAQLEGSASAQPASKDVKAQWDRAEALYDLAQRDLFRPVKGRVQPYWRALESIGRRRDKQATEHLSSALAKLSEAIELWIEKIEQGAA